MIELRWAYKDTEILNTKTKVLEFRQTHEVVDKIIAQHDDGSYTTSGKHIQEIENPIWLEVPTFCESGTFLIA